MYFMILCVFVLCVMCGSFVYCMVFAWAHFTCQRNVCSPTGMTRFQVVEELKVCMTLFVYMVLVCILWYLYGVSV